MTIMEAKKNINAYVICEAESIPTRVAQALDIAKACMEECENHAKAKENNLSFQVPVAIGTTVYKIEPSKDYFIETKIMRYDIYEDSIWFCFKNGLGRNINDFGNYVFLTKEKAEQKIKELFKESK